MSNRPAFTLDEPVLTVKTRIPAPSVNVGLLSLQSNEPCWLSRLRRPTRLPFARHEAGILASLSVFRASAAIDRRE